MVGIKYIFKIVLEYLKYFNCYVNGHEWKDTYDINKSEISEDHYYLTFKKDCRKCLATYYCSIDEEISYLNFEYVIFNKKRIKKGI